MNCAPAKGRIDVIQMRLLGVCDEELLLVGVGAAASHGNDASAVVLQRISAHSSSPGQSKGHSLDSAGGIHPQ